MPPVLRRPQRRVESDRDRERHPWSVGAEYGRCQYAGEQAVLARRVVNGFISVFCFEQNGG